MKGRKLLETTDFEPRDRVRVKGVERADAGDKR
jgi:hypothetical protein